MNLTWVTTEDAEALAQAHAGGFAAPWSALEIVDLLQGPGAFGLLAADARPRGMILCRVAANEMEVLTLAVDPQVRRQGVAKALMAAALGAAREAGAREAFLEVAVDNDAAAALYAGMGFRRAGLRRGYYDRGEAGAADALVMRLDLNDGSA
jgi:[ribosomal protein S18]-alanine N-acetyltransferase